MTQPTFRIVTVKPKNLLFFSHHLTEKIRDMLEMFSKLASILVIDILTVRAWLALPPLDSRLLNFINKWGLPKNYRFGICFIIIKY